MTRSTTLAPLALASALALALAGCGTTGDESTSGVSGAATSTATATASATSAPVRLRRRGRDLGRAQRPGRDVRTGDVRASRTGRGDEPDPAGQAEHSRGGPSAGRRRDLAAQGPEIEQMDRMLQAWEASATAEPGGMEGMDHGSMDGGSDGMIGEEDLDRLESAQGTEAAQLYLEQMTPSTTRARSTWPDSRPPKSPIPRRSSWPMASWPPRRPKSPRWTGCSRNCRTVPDRPAHGFAAPVRRAVGSSEPNDEGGGPR